MENAPETIAAKTRSSLTTTYLVLGLLTVGSLVVCAIVGSATAALVVVGIFASALLLCVVFARLYIALHILEQLERLSQRPVRERETPPSPSAPAPTSDRKVYVIDAPG